MEYTEMLEKQVGQLRKANETDYAAYMHALSAANKFRDERDALKAQVRQLREALESGCEWCDQRGEIGIKRVFAKALAATERKEP
jgi:predicted negative regulator of RcsB-dependent stress response